ncbi:MAG: Flp family type IVb pilin [Alphaproteobacteria bacterium]|nr:MAG: Flp family type IVb pilin [Alphaproteobacteria bacterium]
MTPIVTLVRRVLANRAGISAIEYALVAALIALVIVASVRLVGQQTAANIQQATDAVSRAAP